MFSIFSFERYIRICYYCQLRETSVLSEDNVKFYKLFVVLFPILFYVPKCFEVRSHYVVKEVKMQIDCQKVSFIYKLSTNLWYLSIIFFPFCPRIYSVNAEDFSSLMLFHSSPLSNFGYNPSLIDGILNVLPYELAS